MKETSINVFRNPAFGEIRTTLTAQGEPLFCLADVCRALDIANPRDCKTRLNPKGCQIINLNTVGSADGTSSSGGNPNVTFITEGNLYKCVFQSRKPEAEQFQDWVTEEVLPTIRKTGAYSLQLPTDYAGALRLAADLYEENQAQKALMAQTQKVLEQTAQSLAEAEPKAAYCDNVLCSVSLISVRQIAKDYGRSANWLNRYLASKGIQFRQGRQWLLYDKYARQDLARSVTAQGTGRGDNQTYMLTKWTERGRKFIARLLARDGIYPVPTAEEYSAIDRQLEML